MARFLVVTFVALLAAASCASLQGARAAPGPPGAAAPASAFDAAARREIAARLGEELRDRYVFPDVAERAAARIDAALAAGEYDGLADPAAFVERLSADVQAIAHDKHLRIMSPTAAPAGGGPRAIPPDEAGVVRADRLAGGIGYIEVVGFPPPGDFKPALDRAMSALKDSRALIVDVRRNGGGVPESAAYLVSYLVEPGRPVSAIVARVPKTIRFTRESLSSVPTPVSFAGVPVYVLTSRETFSGGEDFAYAVQALGRGTIVGEVTGGGANPTGPVDLGHGVVASIPFGRSENPVTKTNWEGRGVQPAVAVPASDALRVALQKAGQEGAGEIEAASLERVFEPRSTAQPGYETAMRRLIAGFISGQPDYSIMEPEFADQTRRDLPRLHADLAPLGELRSVRFRRPMMGGDEFELTFANGMRWMPIVLDSNGKIVATLPPIEPPAGQ
jgi:Peptidase family S41/N-terminal domain of Peptidase_S41 in eukaryotic IRBP